MCHTLPAHRFLYERPTCVQPGEIVLPPKEKKKKNVNKGNVELITDEFHMLNMLLINTKA